MEQQNIARHIVTLAQRVKALSQNGLLYSTNEYDTDRYNELSRIADELLSDVSGQTPEQIAKSFPPEDDYVTPKVDIRAAVFDTEGRILLVRERDGLWSVPGGWADVGYSPREVAVKEVKEETGLDIRPVRLIAVHDKKCHAHPPATHYAYKILILCEIVGGEMSTAFDILDRGFFAVDALPPLSEERILKEQIDLMVKCRKNNHFEAQID